MVVLAAVMMLIWVEDARATPGEDTFIGVRALQLQPEVNHEAVVAACRTAVGQRTADGEPILVRMLPVIRSIEAWHLLQIGRDVEAAEAFQAALNTRNTPDVVARAADTIARRWLSRFDRDKVVTALKDYHREYVEYPGSLEDLAAWRGAKDAKSVLRDRQNEPWIYRTGSFRRLDIASRQRYTLHSRAIGRETSSLADARKMVPPGAGATFVRKNTTDPAVIELHLGGESRNTMTIQEGGLIQNVRFAAFDSHGRFALLANEDFWFTAIPAGAGR